MISVDIPGFRHLDLAHLVLDYNGTLALDGALLPGVADALKAIAPSLSIHVITADTFGSAAANLRGLPVSRVMAPHKDQHAAKMDYVKGLGAHSVVAIGNGRNDRKMVETAAIGIALAGPLALLLASLAQLGDPLAEEAIICPPEGSACAQLSLEQTRERLGALVAACGRSHGLGAGEMAEALTIATALALHQCRDLVPLTRGAGLAVTGLVEGANSAPTLAVAA